MQSKNIIVITGDQLRHKYFVNQLNARFPLAAVFHESFHYPEQSSSIDENQLAWDWFFSRREAYEQDHFASSESLEMQNQPVVEAVSSKHINSAEFIDKLGKYDPGFIAIYGTGKFGPAYLERFSKITYNLHLGLPHLYRGSSCNFWPIHEMDLENIGSTVHQVEAGLDTGKIAAQGVVALKEEDDEQTLGGRTLKIGTQLMIDTIQKWRDGKLNLRAQSERGKLYLIKDFTPQAARRVKKMVDSGQLRKAIHKIKQQSR
ncbi:MAG: hypothetical protein G3M78_09420 [Candidatus Nitrohelix vancouverensis]|uniref:phosphoribosylglycinamide formyltransferase 1 n=1 Tax=Candidatus Nitrohelix vancouverensis TaxID=2705534 RepID=A0A7T0G3N4_9BACT|nr:MAG: hypothetical protein G3M78_09420 [Candidatus Nitrohelix vancouverensis]